MLAKPQIARNENWVTRAFPIWARVRHWLLEVDEHSVHAPFLYELLTTVVHVRPDFAPFADIEVYRSGLLANPDYLEVQDLGSGSRYFASTERAIAKIAATSPATPEEAHFYFRLATFRKPKTILELGTSFGISTLYLARATTGVVHTFEGSPAIAAVAMRQFESLHQKNIKLHEGNLDSTLPRVLDNLTQVDMAILDANHRYEPTLRYLEALVRKSKAHTVIIIHDIHASREMEAAWNKARHHELVYVDVDLFFCGLLFFDPVLHKQSLVASLQSVDIVSIFAAWRKKIHLREGQT